MADPASELPVFRPNPGRQFWKADLLNQFRWSKRSYWTSFMEHHLLLECNRDNPLFEASSSPHLETMAFFKWEMGHFERMLTERGAVAPSRTATVVSVFLDDPQDDAPPPAPVPVENEPEPVAWAAQPLREALEQTWDMLDRKYLLCWVQQNLFLLRNPAASDDQISNTPFYFQMMIFGRALELTETRLQRMGWVRPPPRTVENLFSVDV